MKRGVSETNSATETMEQRGSLLYLDQCIQYSQRYCVEQPNVTVSVTIPDNYINEQ